MSRRQSRKPAPVRFRLTRAGWLFLSVAVLLGVSAVKSQAGMMFVLFGAMMAALHLSAVTARRMLLAVQLQREVPSRAWQNRTVHLGYALRNTHRRRGCMGLSVRELAPTGIDSADGYCVHLPAQAVFRSGGRFAALVRGRIHLREMQLSTIFPFGLVEARRRIAQDSTVIIWPARGRLRNWFLRRGAVEVSSAAPSPATGGQDEFFGLRDYRGGDNPRWIHWRRSACRPIPVLREMSRPLPDLLWVFVDTRRRQDAAEAVLLRERLLRFAATLIDHAVAQGYMVGLALAFSSGVKTFSPQGGRGQWQALLDALADMDDNTAHGLERTLRAVRVSQVAQAQVVVAAGEDDVDSYALRSLRSFCRHMVVVRARELDGFFDDSGAKPSPDADSPDLAPAGARRPALAAEGA